MASISTSSSKEKRGSEMLVRGVEWKSVNFKLVPAVAEGLDTNGVQSQIPPNILVINNTHTYFRCTIQEIGTIEMDNSLGELCVDGTRKPEHKHLKTKGLTHILHLPRNFQIKWIRYILR